MLTSNLVITTHRFTDCITPDGGYPTQDGYIRVLTKLRRLGGLLKMRHRIEWEKVNGPIPDGYEIDHMCKVRACCNVDHLQCLSRSKHKSKDNAERYKDREIAILKFINHNPHLLQREVGSIFGVSQSCISGIIKRNRSNE